MIQFTHPLYLVLLPPLIYFTWRLSRVSMADLSRGRKLFSLSLRIVIITLLLLAIAGIQFVRPSKSLTVIFAVDISDSIPREKRQASLDYIRNALKSKRSTDYIGVIAFGADAVVELAPCRNAKVDRIYAIPSTSYTDIAQGIGLSLASFPPDAAKRIVLLSDGNENLGKALDQTAMAETEGITIDVVPLANDVKKEALLDKIVVPSEVRIGEPFELKVIATAKTDTHSEIRLLRNGHPADVKNVTLTPGKNVFTFSQTIDKAGAYSYEALLSNNADTMLDNNRALGSTIVRGKPKVLYVEGKPGESEHLAKALRASDITVDVRGKSGIPAGIDDIRDYDSIIFSDIPAMAMMPEQMKLIEAGVRDLGIGFGMIGGEDSFGAGGYFDTPIERTLPVDMSIRKQKVLPSLSVVIVIDKSGSMSMDENGRTKISLANEAAVNVVELLQPIDKIGVIFCHDYPETIVPLSSAKNKAGISQKITTVTAGGGGITVFPSLKAAYDMISGSGTRQKHVIMLCDGDDCDEQSGCISLADQMRRERITVTSVAIGSGKDVQFLTQLAAVGGGNYYLARRAQELPYIFTKDVMLVSKSLLVEEPFRPRVDGSSQVLSGIDWDTAPPLLGYVSTSPKPVAEVPMISHKDDPIYAQWQFGLGRSIAFTSDAKSKWAVRWLEWPGFTKFWAQSIRWSMKKSCKSNFQTAVTVDQAIGRVAVDAIDREGRFINFLKLKGWLIGPDMKSYKILLEQTAPGRYEAEFPARQVGTYTVNIVEKQGEDVSSQSCTVTIPYPPEYKDIQTNHRLLERIAKLTGGKVSPKPQDVFKPDLIKARVPTDLWWGLTLIAILLFPLDVATRRLAMDASEIRAFAAKGIYIVRSKISRNGKTQKKAQEVETVRRLLDAKKSRHSDEPRPDWARPQSVARQSKPDDSRPITPTPTPEANKPKEEESAQDMDMASRLLEAKRRARERHER